MALRRPLLLICFISLVVGLKFDLNRRSFRLQKPDACCACCLQKHVTGTAGSENGDSETEPLLRDVAGKQHNCGLLSWLFLTEGKKNFDVVCPDMNDTSTDERKDELTHKRTPSNHTGKEGSLSLCRIVRPMACTVVPGSDDTDIKHGTDSQSEMEHLFSVFSIFFVIALARNDRLKERVLMSLSNLSEYHGMLKTFLDVLAGWSNLPQDDSLACYHKPSAGSHSAKPDHHVSQHKRKDERTSSKYTAKVARDKDGTEGSLSFYRNVRRTAYRVFPATFLPSVGSSPTDMMSHLGSRLASLFTLPTSCSISRVRLAQAGFYYDTSKTDRNASNAHELTCYSCGLTYGQWKDGDNPAEVHFRLRPDCIVAKAEADSAVNAAQPRVGLPPAVHRRPASLQSVDSGISSMASSTFSVSSSGAFSASSTSLALSEAGSFSSVLQADSGLGGSSFGLPTSRAPGLAAGGVSDPTHSDSAPARRTNGLGDLETDASAILPQPDPVTTPSSSAAAHVTRPPMNAHDPRQHAPTPSRAQYVDEHPALVLSNAVYPQFSIKHDRLKTFSTWPTEHAFRPEDLVMQGLYYAGYADCLRCFYCGVGLKSWSVEDDPLVEHIRYRPSCGFLLNIKGRQFVNSILQRLQPLTPTPNLAPATSAAPLTSATTSASSPGTVSHAGSVPLAEMEVMGFSKDQITKALKLLQQNSPGTNITAEALVEKILELDSKSANNPAPEDRLDQDGPASEGAEDEDSEYSKVIRENHRLRTRNTCMVCHEARVGLIFLPCGHVNTCGSCGNKIKHCATCGQHIKATANVFLS